MYACPRIPPIAKALLVELRVYYSHDLREISKLSRHVILLFERSEFSNGDLTKKKVACVRVCVCVYQHFHWSIGSQSRELDVLDFRLL